MTHPADNTELYEKLKFVVDKGQRPLRVDKYLFNRLESLSRNKIQQLIEAQMLLVNGKVVKSNYKVKNRDVLSLFAEHSEHNEQILPENIPLDLLYEDDSLLIVNKPAGLVVHPGCGNTHGTLVNALAFYFQDTQVEVVMRHGLVHRIDKDTSGILVVAKHANAVRGLVDQFSAHTIDRLYLALVWGNIKDNGGVIHSRIGRHKRYRQRFAAYPEHSEEGKHACTQFRVLKRFRYVTLIACTLTTGRTHQIRVHMQSIGHPLFGDKTYGGDKIVYGTRHARYDHFAQQCLSTINRQALHACRIGFLHPQTGKKIRFTSPPPPDFTAVCVAWQDFSEKNM